MKHAKSSHSHNEPKFSPKSHDAAHRVNPGRVAHSAAEMKVKTVGEGAKSGNPESKRDKK